MVIVSYDISDDKLRSKFAKFLSKFGYRIQYSVFKIENSERLLNIIIDEIQNKYSKKFTQSDSVYIFKLSSSCKVIKYGYAANEDDNVIFVKWLANHGLLM